MPSAASTPTNLHSHSQPHSQLYSLSLTHCVWSFVHSLAVTHSLAVSQSLTRSHCQSIVRSHSLSLTHSLTHSQTVAEIISPFAFVRLRSFVRRRRRSSTSSFVVVVRRRSSASFVVVRRRSSSATSVRPSANPVFPKVDPMPRLARV